MVLFFAVAVHAAENETIPTTLDLTGNIPTTTIFLDEAGDDGVDKSISLQPNETTLVSCWGTAFDLDGNDDLDNVTSVLYAQSSTREDVDNASIHYTNSSCDLTGFETTGTWNCTYNVQYYAENSTWTCIVNITNDDPQYHNDTANETATIQDLVALDVGNASIDFGLRAVTVNYTADTEVRVYNEGNVELDLQLDAFNQTAAFDDDDANAFNCSIGYIPVNYLRFSLSDGAAYLSSTPMNAAGATATEEFNLAHQNGGGDDLPTFDATYWAIGIPANIAGTCQGQVMYIGRPGGP
ncbi:MAG: hypothetical protein ACOC32_01115 [Nanoarchaeota archaeon]